MRMSIYQLQILKDIRSAIQESTNMYRAGIFGFGKKKDSQITLLTEIRDLLDPDKQSKGGIWEFLNLPIKKIIGDAITGAIKFPFKLFTKKKTREEKTLHQLNQETVHLLEENLDYQDDTIDFLEKIFELNKERYKNEQSLSHKIESGITVLPSPVLGLYETKSLEYLKDISLWNEEEFVAIGDIPKDTAESLCKCFDITNKEDSNTNEELLKTVKETNYDNLRKGMDDIEEKRDMNRTFTLLLDRVDGIYKAISSPYSQQQPKNITPDKSILAQAGDKIEEGVKAVLKRKTENIFNRETVNISKSSIRDMCRCMSSNFDSDDGGGGYDIDGKKRSRKRGKYGKKGSRKWKRNAKDRLKRMKGRRGFKKLFKKTGKVGVKGLLKRFGSSGLGTLLSSGLDIAGSIGSIFNSGLRTIGTKIGLKGAIGGLLGAAGGAVIADMIDPSSVVDATLTGNNIKPMSIEDQYRAAGMSNLEIKKLQNSLRSQSKDGIAGSDGSVDNLKIESSTLIKEMNKAGRVFDSMGKSFKTMNINGAMITIPSMSIDNAKKVLDSLRAHGMNKENLAKWENIIMKKAVEGGRRLNDMVDTNEIIDAIKESKTKDAVMRAYNDAKTFANNQMSQNTTINMPISASDGDKDTNLLVHTYGS